VRTLNVKLVRDLWSLGGQTAAIGIVIAAGVMVLIISASSLDALRLSQERFYQNNQFAHVFADLKRAPELVAERLRQISGVDAVETRVVAPVRLEVPGFPDPVRGLLLSVPDGHQPSLNRLHMREGSLPDPARADQVIISEPFAEAHALRPGDTLAAIIQGRLERLVVSGVALSPEFIYQIGPADLMPDHERYGVFWMNRRTLAHAFGMDGAFNNVVMTLQAGVAEAAVIAEADRILGPYGGVGAYGREDQVSHRFLEEELGQLRVQAIILPAIFLGVAAFLLNILMARIIRTQRQQVAVLKAFGYTNRELAAHYGMLTGVIVLLGATTGIAVGAWAAEGLAGVYAEYFRFPEMLFRLQPRIVALGLLVAFGAAALGTYRAVAHAVSLPPAEAMRPPAPERFRHGRLELTRIGRLLDQPTRIIVRNLSRHRVKAALSVVGVALSAALLLLGSFMFGAIDHMLDVQYRLVQRMDVHLAFTDATPERAVAELRVQPGVDFVETYRSVPVRLVNGLHEFRTGILGLEAEPALRRLIDADYRPIGLPAEGLVVTRYLAEHLNARPGDTIEVEVMEGHRRTVDVTLAAVVDEYIGVSAYMERRALNRLMREGPAISGAWLLTDRSRQAELVERLWDMPRIAGIGLVAEAETNIRDYIEDTVLIFMGILLLLAGSIAFAVIYNNARIAFSERSRELATLRVLGFSHGEVAWILMGEIILLTILAIPLGWALGTLFAWLLNQAMSMDLFRVPFVIDARTYAFAAAGVIAASALSLLLILRRLRGLDMVSALKTVE
jgi:putative ABC transport system permease protein